ncbi:A/G-specific adenine glycosylase [Rubritalea marina]|uniref:A/G-specific adenine glycosylase n=1 Tax=Rubritalea marina TaxID=361055 RepID=UPI0003649743|nr:A/G-specific adenine glycosylase [Rubritalea marina]
MQLKDIAAFQSALVTWFEASGKDYPWRQTTDPWHILVSEVMLQQTQVATVLNRGFYVNFLKRYPTPKSIAYAPEQEILSAWEGLGYYRRVRNLQKAARAISEEHGGHFPTDHQTILKLPGIGRYTAGAIASFAYNQAQPIVDANVARVLSRVFNFRDRVDNGPGQKQLWSWAEQVLDHQHPRLFNSALMELGQRVCTNKAPDCLLCPIRAFCTATEPESLPVKQARKKTVHLDEHCLLAIRTTSAGEKELLLSQASQGDRRSGMWSLPQRPLEQLEPFDLLYRANYAITHHKVHLQIYHYTEALDQSDGEVWHAINTLADTPIPSPFRKALDQVLPECF